MLAVFTAFVYEKPPKIIDSTGGTDTEKDAKDIARTESEAERDILQGYNTIKFE